MKKKILTLAAMGLAAFALCPMAAHAADAAPAKQNAPLNIRVVNFKKCVEDSKVGKKEQETFEALKKQMESVLEEKEKALNEIGSKFNDPDYLDSLSPEAETDLKRKFRALNQEITEQQNQYYQTLQQTNFKVIQKLTDAVAAAAQKVAKDNHVDLMVSEETSFYYSPDLDLSKQVVAEMDRVFDLEEKEVKESKPGV